MSTHLSRLICRGSAVASSEPAPVNVWIYRLVSLTLSPFIHSNPAKALRSAGIREVEELPVLLVFFILPFRDPWTRLHSWFHLLGRQDPVCAGGRGWSPHGHGSKSVHFVWNTREKHFSYTSQRTTLPVFRPTVGSNVATRSVDLVMMWDREKLCVWASEGVNVGHILMNWLVLFFCNEMLK